MRRSVWVPVAALACAASCGAPRESSASAQRDGGTGRVVEVRELPDTHRELLRAYGAGGETWEQARETALADPALTQFLVENLFLELARAHRALGGAAHARAQEARLRAHAELTRIGAAAAPTIGAFLEVRDDVTATLATEVLESIGRPALPAALQALGSERAHTRRRAAEALSRMQHGARDEPRVRAALIEARVDPEWFVRAQVARALGARGARDVETEPWRTALQSMLLDTDEAVVEAAAVGLMQLGDGRAIGVLIDVLARAVEAGDARKFNALQAALVRLSGAAEQPSVEAWRAWWRANRARFEAPPGR